MVVLGIQHIHAVLQGSSLIPILENAEVFGQLLIEWLVVGLDYLFFASVDSFFDYGDQAIFD